MELKINLDTEFIKDELNKRAQNLASENLNSYLSVHFNRGGYWNEKKGFGTIQIQEQIDKLLTSDDLNDKIAKLVEKHFDTALEEAVKHACKHKAKKVAFNTIIPKE